MPPLSLGDPNLAFLLLVLGALGVYWEMHAPGLILPGVIGFLLLCAAAYGLYQDTPTWYGLMLLAFALLLLGIELKFYTHMVSGLTGAILLAWGAIVLIQGPRRITPALAMAVAIAFGAIADFPWRVGKSCAKDEAADGRGDTGRGDGSFANRDQSGWNGICTGRILEGSQRLRYSRRQTGPHRARGRARTLREGGLNFDFRSALFRRDSDRYHHFVLLSDLLNQDSR